jgi:TusA-related sulfurtransferase
VSGRPEVDARGLACPLPAMRTRIALKGRPAALDVLVSDGAARSSVEDLLRDDGYAVAVAEDGDGWRVSGDRAPGPRTRPPPPPARGA